MVLTSGGCTRVFAVVLAALVLAPAAQAAPISPPPPEHRADPSLTTYVERLGPYTIGSYETLQKAATAKPPPVAGAIVAMDARLVDASGAVIPQQITMLHHLVFTNGGPDDRRGDPACPLKTTRERFWGTSEELRPMTLPPGYGYPTIPADQLARAADGHAPPRRRAGVLPRVPRDRRPAPGDPGQAVLAERRSRARPTRSGRCPATGRRRTGARARSRCPRRAGSSPPAATCTAARRRSTLSQPRCKDRTLVRNLPAYAPAGDPLYKVRPLLHEPDPKNISWWQSATGWAITQGRAAQGHRGLRRHAPAHARDGDRARLRRAARWTPRRRRLRAAAARRPDARRRVPRRRA